MTSAPPLSRIGKDNLAAHWRPRLQWSWDWEMPRDWVRTKPVWKLGGAEISTHSKSIVVIVTFVTWRCCVNWHLLGTDSSSLCPLVACASLKGVCSRGKRCKALGVGSNWCQCPCRDGGFETIYLSLACPQNSFRPSNQTTLPSLQVTERTSSEDSNPFTQQICPVLSLFHLKHILKLRQVPPMGCLPESPRSAPQCERHTMRCWPYQSHCTKCWKRT